MLPSLSFYIGNKLFLQVFDGTSIERTIAPPSDGPGSI